LERRARVSVWPGRRNVPSIVAPEPWGARGAECLPRDVLRRSSPATSSRDGTTARRCLCHRTGSGTTQARPSPESSVPPVPHGGQGGLSRHAANPGPDFRSSSSSFITKKSTDTNNPPNSQCPLPALNRAAWAYLAMHACLILPTPQECLVDSSRCHVKLRLFKV